MTIVLITSQINYSLGVSCLILVSQHYHQVIHNRGQHGSSRRFTLQGCTNLAEHVQAIHSHTGKTTQHNPNLSPHHAQRTTCIACTANQAPLKKDPHSTLRPCRPKCRLHKFHLGTRGAQLHMHASNGKPKLSVVVWTRCESGQN